MWFLPRKSTIKRSSAYSRLRANGIIAINVRDDSLIEALLTDGEKDILLAGRKGRCCRFHESTVRAMGRTAAGVRGIRIDEDDEVVGMICVEASVVDGSIETETESKELILVISENGFGKCSSPEEYRTTNRGGKGVKTINITEKTGSLIAIKSVTREDDLMIINKYRLPTSGLQAGPRRVSRS